MRRVCAVYVTYMGALCLAFILCACALFQRPPVATPTPPVIHVAPAPEMPKFDFRPGADGTAYLTFADYLAFEEANAKLYARLSYFRTLLIQYGAIFDPPSPAQAVP